MHNTRISLGLYLAGLIGLLAFTPAVTFAQDTAADTDVSNTATVSYEFDGAPQPDETGEESFEVDARVQPVVTLDNAPEITIGEDDTVTEFTVTNSGNQTQDFIIDLVQPTDDDFDLENVVVYRDGGDGVFDPDDPLGGDDIVIVISTQDETQVGRIDDIAAGDDVTVWVVGDVPETGVDPDDSVDLDLIATAFKSDGSGIEVATSAGSADIDTVDTVFADADGPATVDDATDGQASDDATLTTPDDTISVTKGAEVRNSDGSGGADQFYLPGERVRYTITLDYSGLDEEDASNIVMADPIPANTTYVAGSITLNTVAQTDADDDPGTDFSDFGATTADTVTVVIQGTRNSSSSDDVITFDVTID
ncbi:MAG: hypothetical protein AAF065_10700 [Verrucomicrobiota bacterium]